jgi:hypothetical protein
LDALNLAAWKADNPHRFLAIKITLPGRVLRLTAGGVVVIAGETFLPEDPDIGVWTYVKSFEEGAVDSAVAPDLGFACHTNQGVVELSESHGSRWEIYWGLIDADTGAVVGAPEQWDCGYLNMTGFVPNARRVRAESYTEEQFQLLADRQKRLSPAFHKSIRPGETGLDNVTEVDRKIYWLAKEPPRAIRLGGSGGGGGGPRINDGPNQQLA